MTNALSIIFLAGNFLCTTEIPNCNFTGIIPEYHIYYHIVLILPVFHHIVLIDLRNLLWSAIDPKGSLGRLYFDDLKPL